jgi:acyl carrier protein
MNTQEVVLDLLKTHCGLRNLESPVTRDTRLVEDLGLDSVGLLTLVVEIENHYQVRLEESSEDPPRSLGQLTDLIDQRLAGEEFR